MLKECVLGICLVGIALCTAVLLFNERANDIEKKIDQLNGGVVELKQVVSNLCRTVHHQWVIMKKFD